MKTTEADLVVIGGGPSGMLCAIRAAERGKRVVILDGNRSLGRKLRITGKGRCNLTNDCDVREVMRNIPGDGRFLYSALTRFPPEETMALFRSLGVPLKTERGNRVFPVSDRADDVADALARRLETLGVRVLRSRATGILTDKGAVCGVGHENGVIDCRAAALCTGGRSYPLTGSDGAGYELARALGHTVVPTRPSLVPLVSDDEFCAEMQGFSLRNVVLRAYEDDRLIYHELGEIPARWCSPPAPTCGVWARRAIAWRSISSPRSMKKSSTSASCAILRNMPTANSKTRSTISRRAA